MADDLWTVAATVAAAASALFALISAWIALQAYRESAKDNKRREADAKRARENEALNYLSTFDLENWNLRGNGPAPTTPAWNRLKEDIAKLVSYRGSVPDSFKEDFGILCDYMVLDSEPTDPRLKKGAKLLPELRQRARDEMRNR
jgi:hypothetical protein